MNTAQLSYGHVHYTDAGEGEPLLLVHGFPLDHSMWRSQIESLSQSHRLIVPDLGGFGRSSRTTRIESMKSLADELVELLDHLGIDRVTFCGLSMGGYIGWQFWKHHGNRLNRIIACNTRAAADSETIARARKVTAQNVRSEGLAKFADDMVPRLFAPANLTGLKNEVEQLRETILSTDRETVAQSLEAMAIRPDVTSWISQIEVPILFVGGAYDTVTPPDEMQGNAALIPGAHYVVIPDAGHLSPLENPSKFNDAVGSFLEKLS